MTNILNSKTQNSSTQHWADFHARKVIEQVGDKKEIVTASGITPSGTIHVGNFREIITVHLITEALKDLGKKVKFNYSWDNFDRFRKVPGNIEENIRKKLTEEIGKPVYEVPDYFGCHKNYALHFQTPVIDDCKNLGIKPNFQNQHKHWTNCDYSKEVKKALNNIDLIKLELEKYRQQPLNKDWYPITVYCKNCGKDNTKILDYDKNYLIKYSCYCKTIDEVNFKKEGKVKLRWRIDWPMRWSYYGVDFEPAGKDHFAAGSARTTGVEICEKLYESKAPYGFMYEFIGLKGLDGKMSGSKGNVYSIKHVSNNYLLPIVNYLFAGTKPNKPFKIGLDDDLLKVYEDYYFCERIYYGVEKSGVSKRDKLHWKRVYELSNKGFILSEKIPEQIRLRKVIDTVQTFEKKLAIKELGGTKRVKELVEKTLYWLKTTAPKEYVYEFTKPSQIFLKSLKTEDKKVLLNFAKRIENVKTKEEVINVCKNLFNEGVNQKKFFTQFYQTLFSKNQGPRIAAFIETKGGNLVSKKIQEHLM